MRTSCAQCGAEVRDVVDEPRAGWPVTINAAPTTWPGALVAVVTGRRVVYARDTKRADGPGLTREHYRLDATRISAGPGDVAYYAEHRCGTTDPPPPPSPPTAWPAPDIDPPF